MSVDRLAELNRSDAAQAPGRYEMRPLLSSSGGGRSASDVTTMDGFLAAVSHVQETLRGINENVGRLQGLQSAMLQAADGREEARLRGDLDALTAETQRMMTHVKEKLKEMEPNGRQGDLAIRKNQFASVTRTFMETIQRHRQVQVDFQAAEARQFERQIRIANPHATADEIQKAVAQAEQGGGGPAGAAVFAQQLMQSMTSEQRRHDGQQALDAVQERHDDIRRLAQSVEELSNLFAEMQFLLENQANVLETIEDSSYQVVHDLEKGHKEVGKAVHYAKLTRKKKWICFGIFVAIIIIVVIVIAVEVTRNTSASNNNQTTTPAEPASSSA